MYTCTSVEQGTFHRYFDMQLLVDGLWNSYAPPKKPKEEQQKKM